MTRSHSTLTRNAVLSAVALLTSSATLVCCVLPAVLVALGAGAALAGLVSAVPQLVWLSEHKQLVFGVAATFLAASGAAIWYGRSLPCPANPLAARTCQRLRRLSAGLYAIALASFAIGATFAFALPLLGANSDS
jgi:hypothetical protein